jgi:hypothetical protein
VTGQFRGWAAARQAESEYRGWLTELSTQVPRGECVIAFNATDAIYSNHSVYGNWQLFYQARDPLKLRAEMDSSGCRYLVVDSDLRTFAPEFVPVAENALRVDYTSRDGSRKIYELIP